MLSEIFGMDGIVVVVVLAILVFGGAAIPKLARNLGSAKHQFEKGLGEGKKASAVEDADVVVVPVPVPLSASVPAE
jgi:Sec-independent protein translocase protein TatA